MTAEKTATTPTATTEPTTTESRGRRGFAGFSVRTRITVAVSVLVGLALAGAGLVVNAIESAHIHEAVTEQVEQELAEFSRLQERGIDPETSQGFTSGQRLIRVFLERNVPDDDELLVGYWDDAPRVRSGARPGDRDKHESFARSPQFLEVVSQRQIGGGTQVLDTEWGEVVVTVQPVSSPAPDASATFVIANFLADEHEELNRVMRTYAIVSLLSLGLITAIAAWQAGRLLRPVRTLRETAEEISETDLSRRIPVTGNDDITALTRTVNAMLERLESAFTGQRQFLDDVGHELKTPLTVMSGHMELVDTTDPEDVESSRAILLGEVDRMSRLVNDLSLLAQTDRPDFYSFERVSVAPLTELVLDKCRALGDREWVLDEQAEFLSDLDEQRITQALLQLAENAVKHTGSGDVIGVGSRVDSATGLQLWVRDTGSGVPEAEKGAIFDRFERGGHLPDDPGFGLGLSIVSRIAAAHGGTVAVEDVVPHGAKFVITLPPRRRENSWPAS